MQKIWTKIKNWFLDLIENEDNCECECEHCCNEACECVTTEEEVTEETEVADSSIECVELDKNEDDVPIKQQFVDLQDAGRKLAFLLRHDKDYDFPNDGFRTVENLVSECGYTAEQIEEIVATDDKGRYEYNEDHTAVRACQGHSVLVDVGLTETPPPMFLYHGTTRQVLDSIMEKGILPKSRLYVHLSENIATAQNVGKRHGNDVVVLRIFAQDMFNDGFKFLLSANNVWCIDEVPSNGAYFEVVND